METPAGDASAQRSKQNGEAHSDRYHCRHQARVPACESGFSSQEEFSLQATRKALDFESDSQQNSLHDEPSAGGGGGLLPKGFQTQELVSKVQAYLGQCQSPVARRSSRSKTGMAFPGGSVEFGTPERTNKVCLTEQEVTQCVQPDSADNLSSPRSSGEEDKKGVVSQGDSQADQPTEPLDTQRLRPIRQKTRNAVVRLCFCMVGQLPFVGHQFFRQSLLFLFFLMCQDFCYDQIFFLKILPQNTVCIMSWCISVTVSM